MKTLVLASANAHKIKEFKEILNDFNVVPMNEIGFSEDIIEDGKTFAENSKIKAEAIHKFCVEKNMSCFVVADDSGLIVNSLNGEPGVMSARYSGGHGNDKANRDKVLALLENEKDRSAYFACSITLINPNGECVQVEGQTDGIILPNEVGYDGFGYDCIFFSADLGKSFGEASKDEKNSVSHRGRALTLLKDIIKEKKW